MEQIIVKNIISQETPAIDIRSKAPTVDLALGASSAVAALTAASAAGGPVLIPAGTYLIDQDVTCTAPLVFAGGKFSIASGKTLTINGPVQAPIKQIFSGSGTVVFGSGAVGAAYPQWWGAKGDGVANDTAAFQAAVNAASKVSLSKGAFLIDPVNLHSNLIIEGVGPDTRIIQRTAPVASGGTLQANSGSASAFIENVALRDFQIEGPDIVTPVFSEHNHLIAFHGVRNAQILNVRVIGFRGDGIHLGSGYDYGGERHNHDVRICDCLIDGINQENRNGISIIDGNNITVENCVIQNTTKSTMPGAIDIEPNDFDHHVAQNIKIVGNRFENIGGNVGVISFVFANVAWTTMPNTFIVRDNYIDCPGKNGITYLRRISGGITADAPSCGLKILSNTVVSIGRPFNITNAKGVVIGANSFLLSSNTALLSYVGADNNILDVHITDNLFRNLGGGWATGIAVFTASHITFQNNTFDDCPGSAVDFNSGTSSYISFIGNRFLSPGGLTTIAIQKEVAHTFNTPTNIFRDNWHPGLTVYFTAPVRYTNQGATASVADGGTITHGLAPGTPTGVTATGSVAGEIVSVTAKGSTTFTVAIKKPDGTAGTPQTIYWTVWQ
jgi:hypothetical protein